MKSLPGWLVFLAFAAVAGYLMANGHTVHVLTAASFLILLACPLMMMFMHHDHGSEPKKQ